MKTTRRLYFFFLVAALFLFGGSSVFAQEEALFTSIAPDALIVLDLSGSMRWTPNGERMYTNSLNNCDSTTAAFYNNSASGHDKACDIDAYGTVPKYAATSACTEPFYRQSGTGHTVDCSRLAIAKRAIFDVLDDNNSNTITSADETSLGVRIGYMNYYNSSADETDGNYSSGSVKLIWGIASKYSRIFCNSSSSCSPSSVSSPSVNSESASGGTPLASAMNEAKLYLDAHKAADNAKDCRQKFVILVTDGADTYACGGSGSEDQTTQYKRRRATVARAKALADAGYRTFVVGFGALMPHWSVNTLNWAAYYGGTDNPLVMNSGDTSIFTPSTSFCTDSTTTHHNINGDGDHYYATTNDPGELPLSGYAFLASNAAELGAALKQAIDMVRESTYSFCLSSVSSQRTQDENFIYEASFSPRNRDSFWLGYLIKYAINPDGSIGNELWDAGSVLQNRSADSRTIKTLVSGNLVDFTTANITKEVLGVSTDTERNMIVGYFRGSTPPNPESWKLGDIFRSNPITLGTPSFYFEDIRDGNNAFAAYRTANQRPSSSGNRVVVVGANDGQLHGFRTSDGFEVWSFIPPNFLTKLKNIAHDAHPTGLSHQYFVDGPISAADIWLGSGDGLGKSSSEWKTLLVFAEGRGGGANLWSSSPNCDSGFNATYALAFPYFCGYYALDLTNTTSFGAGTYNWHLNPSAAQAPYLGEPWSKIVMGRVKISGGEKWVGFIGGGYNGGDADCAGGSECDLRGKGLFVVDLQNGNILWSFTRATDSTMNYSFPSAPSIVDTDNDGFIDTAYIGDLGGSMWRFKFCAMGDDSSCGTGSWSGGRLFEATAAGLRPIFVTPTVAKDREGNLWVQWGSGDKMDPTAANDQEKFYAVKDTTRTGSYNINNLEDITSSVYVDSSLKSGWYIKLKNQKVLSEATIFGGITYFSTYQAPTGGNPCDQAGTGTLYGVNYTTGNGVFAQYDAQGQPIGTPIRSMIIGSGIPSAPIISFKPSGTLQAGGAPTDLYMTVSGGAGMNVSTQRVNFDPPTLANRTNILHWKDRRLE
jgi:hypothetical protein